MNNNSHRANNGRQPSRRRSVLDLAPLELDCMNTLWPIGEGTVRDIRDRLAARRPRAYTTIMTIMDRLARKGIVERRKSGRAYIYRPHLTAEDARAQALGQVIDSFFAGSKEALLAQLAAPLAAAPPELAPASAPRVATAAAAASASSAPAVTAPFATTVPEPSLPSSPRQSSQTPPAPADDESAGPIDDTLG